MFFLSFCVLAGSLQASEADVVKGVASARADRAAESIEFQLLSRASEANTNLYANLESFVCKEQIERFRGKGRRDRAHYLDTISGKLSFENGLVRYADLRLKDQPLSTMATMEGAWSEGEFDTLLKQTEQLLRTQKPVFESWSKVGEVPAGLYHFDVSEQDSPWDLEVSARHYTIPFRTEVWIARSSGEIMRIVRTSDDIPSELHIQEITWGVTLTPVSLNGVEWLLPGSGEYQVVYGSGTRREWNTMTFSEYQRYGAEVAVRYN
jgi:hypothetical protein